jgi:hypothetical protein
MRRRSRWLLQVAAVVSAFILSVVLSGSASGATDLPRLKTSVIVDKKLRAATLHISASGVGDAFSGIVLTYPDGHHDFLGTATYSDGDSGTWGTDQLPGGSYTFTVYATPAGPNDTGSFPVGKIVDHNAVASETFVIP